MSSASHCGKCAIKQWPAPATAGGVEKDNLQL
jgi:hypothetical protein